MNKFIYKEVFRTVCGHKIGKGCYREVWSCTFDPTIVIKLERDSRSFCNVQEWENWQELQYQDNVKDWLAPCVEISPCGSVLLQKRVKPLSEKELPSKLPAFLTDIKPGNYGWYEDRIVCCDYPSLICTWPSKTTKVDWHL